MAPEDGRVGVMAHELGHLLLGWPDLYDTDYSSAGTGGWDLMAGGSWNSGGNRPAHPTAWCKTRVGWINPTVLWNNAQSVTIPPYENNAVAYKLPVGSQASSEYFLVSNRQQTLFDTNLPGEGLIIEHVDDAKNNNTDENHYLVDIEQADGKRDLNLNANRGDATDPFPTATNTAFTGSSTPNSNGYSGAASNIAITNIARSGDNITADINVGGVAARTWVYNKKVLSTYTWYGAQWAWANIEGPWVAAGAGWLPRRRDQHVHRLVRRPRQRAADQRRGRRPADLHDVRGLKGDIDGLAVQQEGPVDVPLARRPVVVGQPRRRHRVEADQGGPP